MKSSRQKRLTEACRPTARTGNDAGEQESAGVFLVQGQEPIGELPEALRVETSAMQGRRPDWPYFLVRCQRDPGRARWRKSIERWTLSRMAR